MRISVTIILLALAVPATHAVAQTRDTLDPAGGVRESRAGWSLDHTMRQFVRDLSPGYMPRRGTWDYVLHIRQPSGPGIIGIHRIPAEQSAAAIDGPDGPLCNSFHTGEGGAVGSLATYVLLDDHGWRRRGTRFDSRDAEPGEHVFVDWRREDGRWVIAAIGEEREYVEPIAQPVATAPRDSLYGRRLRLPLPQSARLATDTEWYRSGAALQFDHPPRLKYGAPRKMANGSLVYFTTYDGVMLWTTPDELRSSWGPTGVYAPVDREGTFQVYVGWRGNGCN